jgi:hypothetical protein
MRLTFEHNDAAASGFGQVVGDAGSDDPAADDDDVR